ncbi:MAG TPA: hypothetical protein VJT15_20200 [Pyrinomonadaceae bacterium]|nr:hypothetical protein [Pyrinomonadaceae bacterium]
MSRLVSWYSSDPLFAWFTFLQIVSYVILGVTVAIGYRLSVNQSTTNQKLEGDLVTARTKLAEAENRTLELQRSVARRQVSFIQMDGRTNVDGLKPFVGLSAVVEFLPQVEPRRVANDIVIALRRAGWAVDDPIPNETFGHRFLMGL